MSGVSVVGIAAWAIWAVIVRPWILLQLVGSPAPWPEAAGRCYGPWRPGWSPTN